MILVRLTTALSIALLATGCGRQGSDAPVAVSVIGEPIRIADPDRSPLTPGEAILLGAARQGLVRYDGTGQIEPGLAIRWAISDDGLYYTFRLDGIDANAVAKALRAKIAARSRNALKPILGAIDEIVAVTPEVVEIRLKAARPNLLDLLAQPEMGVSIGDRDSGPLLIQPGSEAPVLHLAPPLPEDPEDAPEASERRRSRILLRGERSGAAIARFMAGKTDLVLNGRVGDLPVARAAGVKTRDLRFDPVDGLFGLEIIDRTPFLSAQENRRALAMAIDRARIIASFGVPDWQGMDRMLPDNSHELPQPVRPGWTDLPTGQRREVAAAAIRRWKMDNPDKPASVRLALPDNPGMRLLFALIRADWAAIGVTAIRVEQDKHGELRLVDEVAPSRSATWYLRRFECARSVVCSEAADTALREARTTPEPIERAARIANADLRLAEIVPFIPIARPMRWSLVSARLGAFRTNERGVHPLNHLLEEPR